MGRRAEVVELSKRIESALGLLQRRVDALEHMLEVERPRRQLRRAYEAESRILQEVIDVLREERANPRPRIVRTFAGVAIAAASVVGHGALEYTGELGVHAVRACVEHLAHAASLVEESEAAPPGDDHDEISDDDIDKAIASIRTKYRPASRDDIPWDKEDQTWGAPTVDLWDVVGDMMADRPEELQQAVIDALLDEGLDWISEDYLRTMHE